MPGKDGRSLLGAVWLRRRRSPPGLFRWTTHAVAAAWLAFLIWAAVYSTGDYALTPAQETAVGTADVIVSVTIRDGRIDSVAGPGPELDDPRTIRLAPGVRLADGSYLLPLKRRNGVFAMQRGMALPDTPGAVRLVCKLRPSDTRFPGVAPR